MRCTHVQAAFWSFLLLLFAHILLLVFAILLFEHVFAFMQLTLTCCCIVHMCHWESDEMRQVEPAMISLCSLSWHDPSFTAACTILACGIWDAFESSLLWHMGPWQGHISIA